MLTLTVLPGEGRGPVARRFLAGAALDNSNFRDWAPAFAGESRRAGGLSL